MSKRRSKTKDQFRHARRRLLERFGLEYTGQMKSLLVKEIQSRRWPCVQKQSNRVTIYAVIIEGKKMLAVYDKHRKSIATFLHKNWLSYYTDQGWIDEFDGNEIRTV